MVTAENSYSCLSQTSKDTLVLCTVLVCNCTCVNFAVTFLSVVIDFVLMLGTKIIINKNKVPFSDQWFLQNIFWMLILISWPVLAKIQL